jgi:putative endonuclease
VYTEAVNDRQRLGQTAEEAAARLLERAGLQVVARNVRLPGGEIDLVCREGARWVFVEVKCRQARWGDAPGAAVSWWKRRRIVRLAQHYLKWKGAVDAACRFDVVAVTVADDGTIASRHIRAAFDASDLG